MSGNLPNHITIYYKFTENCNNRLKVSQKVMTLILLDYNNLGKIVGNYTKKLFR